MRGTSTFLVWCFPTLAILFGAPTGAAAEDAGGVLDQAESLQVAGACQEALPLFGRIISSTGPSDPAYARALYHLGACEEDLEDPQGALLHYGQVLDLPARFAGDWAIHARFRRVIVLLARGDDRAAARDLQRLRRSCGNQDRCARVDVQRAWVAVRRGRDREAAALLAKAFPILEATGEDAAWIAEGAVVAGDLWVHRSERRRLKGKASPALVRVLGRRADDLEEAEDHYKDALRRAVPHWSATALLHLGDAFDRFRQDLDALALRLGDDAGVLGPWIEERSPRLRARATEAWALCVAVRRDGGGQADLASTCQARLDAVPAP